MKGTSPAHFRSWCLRWILLLGCITLLAGGCATMSKPKIGIGGTDDNLPRVGR